MNKELEHICDILIEDGHEKEAKELRAILKKRWMRTDISQNSRYYIPKYRYLELKNFCLQVPSWERQYLYLLTHKNAPKTKIEYVEHPDLSDPTCKIAIAMIKLSEKINQVKKAAVNTDPTIGNYIFEAVTKDYPFEYFQTHYDLDWVTRDYWYSKYRQFFHELDKIHP